MSVGWKTKGEVWISGLYFFLTLVAISAQGQCLPSYFPQYGGVPPTSGLNFVTLDLDIESFPDVQLDPNTGEVLADNLREKISEGVSQAGQRWNDGCEGQPANRFPTFIPEPGMSLPQSLNVPVGFGGLFEPTPRSCTEDPTDALFGQSCYAFAELRQNLAAGTAQLEVYAFGGPESALVPTMVLWDGRFHELFAHELGHIFGLAESPCAESVMNQGTAATGGGQVTEGDCLVLQEAHVPRNPLQSLIGGTDAACFLEGYCAGEPPGPWGTIRTSCGWVLRTQTVTVSVSVYDPMLGLFEFIDLLERTIPQYTCVSWFPLAPPFDHGRALHPTEGLGSIVRAHPCDRPLTVARQKATMIS